jgi:hypothetical protein
MGSIRTTTEALPPALYSTEDMPHSVHYNRNKITLTFPAIQRKKHIFEQKLQYLHNVLLHDTAF